MHGLASPPAVFHARLCDVSTQNADAKPICHLRQCGEVHTDAGPFTEGAAVEAGGRAQVLEVRPEREAGCELAGTGEREQIAPVVQLSVVEAQMSPRQAGLEPVEERDDVRDEAVPEAGAEEVGVRQVAGFQTVAVASSATPTKAPARPDARTPVGGPSDPCGQAEPAGRSDQTRRSARDGFQALCVMRMGGWRSIGCPLPER